MVALGVAVSREALVEESVFVFAFSWVASSSKALLCERLAARVGFFLGDSNEFSGDVVEADTTAGVDEDSTAVESSGFRRPHFFRPLVGG